MLKINYRSAVLADVSQLVKLRILMQCEVNSSDPSKVTTDFIDAIESYFVNSLKEKSYFSIVAELDRQLISANGLIVYHKPPSLIGLSGITHQGSC
jgi:hypothetical protein